MHLLQNFKYSVLLFAVVPIGSLIAQTLIDSNNHTISLQEALRRAIKADSRLELNVARAEAAEGKIEQANTRPNPVIGVEAEDFLGTGPIRDAQGIEITIGIRQIIETANKRKKRIAVAQAERSLVDWKREDILTKIEASVRSAFFDVLLAKALLDLRQEQLELAQRSARETALLVEAAQSPQVEQTRTQLVVRQQKFALQQAQQELKAAKSVLASFWGDLEDTEFSVTGGIVLESEIPDFTTLASSLTTTAALAHYDAEERMQKATLDLEHARKTPNLQVFAGSRYFNANDGDTGFVFGIQVPWSLFDRNQGNIRTARAQLMAISHEREATKRELLIKLNSAYRQLVNAQSDANLIRSELLPVAEAALHETEESYNRGQFTFVSVLESRGVLFEVRESYLKALRRYGLAQAEIEALTRPANL